VEEQKVEGLDIIKPKITQANQELFINPKRAQEMKDANTLQHLFRQTKTYKKERKKKKFERKKILKKEKSLQKVVDDIKAVQRVRFIHFYIHDILHRFITIFPFEFLHSC
jgi:hypothetical protein